MVKGFRVREYQLLGAHPFGMIIRKLCFDSAAKNWFKPDPIASLDAFSARPNDAPKADRCLSSEKESGFRQRAASVASTG